MAKVEFKVNKGAKNIATVMKSDHLAEQLESIAAPILSAASEDPNAYYVSTLSMHRFYSSGRSGRVSVQVGAESKIGSRVEAKRGTLARAMGRVGL